MVLENFIVDTPIVWDRVGKKIFENPHVKQGRKMRVQITNAGMVEDLSGYTLALGWKHTVSGVDGLDVFEDSSEANVGIFEMAYTENLMTNLGNLKASLVLTSVEDMVVAESNDFYVKVDNSPFGEDAEQGVGSYTRLAEILLNEESRIAAEVARASAEETRVTDFNALVDSEIIAQNVATKLQAKEAEYLPRLVSNEQQLAEIPSVSDTFFGSNEVKFIAHRGLSAIAPENSLPAYELAGKAGFWGAETDAMVTLDGQWVLMHDGTVDRTTDGTGTVGSLTLAQIKAFKIDIGNNIALYPNLRVPTLSEFLFTCKKYNLVPVIEIKDTISAVDFDSFVNLIKTHGFEDKCVVISFYPNTLQEIRNRSKKIMLQPLLAFTEENIAVAKAFGNSGIDVDYTTVTKALVDLAHADGVRVNAWTVNSYQTAKTLIGQGIDFITTDFVTGVI